jgi:hypothetical protein
MRSKLTLFLALSACVEVDEGSESTVDAPRLIAVLSEPAEATPGQNVRFTAVIVGGDASALSWAFCTTPRSAVDNTSASPACATTLERAIVGDGPVVDAVVPGDACRVFGSETPAGRASNAADASGGYYQPVRVAFGTQVWVARQRIRCALPAAPLDTVREFAQNYRLNQPPVPTALHASLNGVEVPLDALPRVHELQLRLDCLPGELYLHYQQGSAALRSEVERQSVAWFVSAGSISPAHALGLGTWQVPEGVNSAQIWPVLRDERGASAVFASEVTFAP